MPNQLTQLTTEALRSIWERTMGKTPPMAQFEIWAAQHSLEDMKAAIIATAKKNLNMGGMTEEHRLRFASSVMNIRERRARVYQVIEADEQDRELPTALSCRKEAVTPAWTLIPFQQ